MAQHFTCDICGKPVEIERFDQAGKRLQGQPLGQIEVRRGAEILVQIREVCPDCTVIATNAIKGLSRNA